MGATSTPASKQRACITFIIIITMSRDVCVVRMTITLTERKKEREGRENAIFNEPELKQASKAVGVVRPDCDLGDRKGNRNGDVGKKKGVKRENGRLPLAVRE